MKGTDFFAVNNTADDFLVVIVGEVLLTTNRTLALFPVFDGWLAEEHATTYFFQDSSLFEFLLIPAQSAVNGFSVFDFDNDHFITFFFEKFGTRR
jgi:hypothetical protein